MATYADLKARIVRETTRTDLLDELADALTEHIQDACDEFADRRFWFNQSIQSISTAANINSLPIAMRVIDRVAGPYNDLTPVTIDDMPDFGIHPQSGLPTKYAYYNGALRFDVTPDAAYAVTVYGVAQASVLVNDGDTNFWTNEGLRLITAQTSMTLYRDQFRDPEGAALASQAVQSSLDKLIRETERRTRTRPVARLVAPNGRPVGRAFLDRL